MSGDDLVTTAAELDILPPSTVVLGIREGWQSVLEKRQAPDDDGTHRWNAVGSVAIEPEYAVGRHLPAVVLYRPDRDASAVLDVVNGGAR